MTVIVIHFISGPYWYTSPSYPNFSPTVLRKCFRKCHLFSFQIKPWTPLRAVWEDLHKPLLRSHGLISYRWEPRQAPHSQPLFSPVVLSEKGKWELHSEGKQAGLCHSIWLKFQSPGPHTEKLLLAGRGILSTRAGSTTPLRNQPSNAQGGIEASSLIKALNQEIMQVCRDQLWSLIC